jgi:NAD(P)-dependent dehydrogenase (short-subunit alcohol dehydrogenase family)
MASGPEGRELEGKVAIVTGASRGIGRAVALELARHGAAVVVAARTVEPKKHLPGTIGETLQRIEDAGGTALAVQVDVTRGEDLERLVATTIETFGRLDVLINNAADTQSTNPPIDEYPLDNWLHQFNVNLHAPFVLMGLAVPHLRAQGGGVIVNITSAGADMRPVERIIASADDDAPAPRSLLAYGSSKAALNRLTNALAPEVLAQNIAVVCVDPGFTRTEMVDRMGERGFIDANAAAPMDVPVAAILEIVTAEDPLVFSGQVVRAQPHQAG